MTGGGLGGLAGGYGDAVCGRPLRLFTGDEQSGRTDRDEANAHAQPAIGGSSFGKIGVGRASLKSVAASRS